MNHDMIEARRELLSERDSRERFPLLSGRSDWPPERRAPVPGLSPGEATEWKTFWREVDKRLWGEELYQRRVDEEDRLDARNPVRVGELLDKLTDEVRRGAGVREATLEDALPVWRELHAALVERMRAEGHSTDHPLDDWKQIEKFLRDFDAQLTQLRLQEAERRSYDPVPDPDGRAIHPRELEDAQERLIIADRQPGSRVKSTPQPDRMPADERADARATIERQNAIEVPERDADVHRLAPHESRLDWLEAHPTPKPRETEAKREDRLDWLETTAPQHEQSREDDRERDR
jgi:hypothetical protein